MSCNSWKSIIAFACKNPIDEAAFKESDPQEVIDNRAPNWYEI